jgi:hypothetical protein
MELASPSIVIMFGYYKGNIAKDVIITEHLLLVRAIGLVEGFGVYMRLAV